MCWSWQVSLSFTIAELLVVCLLFYRNKFLDRTCALIALVIATQEFFQFLQWAYGDIDDNTTVDDCSLSNKIFTTCIYIVVGGVPLWYYLLLYFMTLFPKNEQPWQKRFYLFLLFLSFFWYIAALAKYSQGNTLCSYLSDSGHLDWGFAALGDAWRAFNAISYAVFLMVLPIVFRPFWFTLIPALNTGICFIILYFIDDWETYGAGSMWCWEAGFNCLWYLITPYVANFIINKYNNNNNNNENSDNNYHCFIRLLFDGTDEIMKKSEEYGSFTIKYGNKIEWRKLLCLKEILKEENNNDEEFKYNVIKDNDHDNTPAV